MAPVLTALLLLSCGGEPRQGHLLTGWELSWEQLSHRLPLVEADLDPDSGVVSLGLIGGDYSTGDEYADTVDYRARSLSIDTDRATFATDEITLTIAPSSEGSGFEASGEITFSEDALEGYSDAVAFVSGFTLNTDVEQSADYPEDYDPGLGYTSLGFGVWLGEVDGSTVPVTVRFAHGPSGEEDVPGVSEGREAMDAAIPFAASEARVKVTLVAYKGDREDLTLSESQELEYDPPYSDQDLFELTVQSSQKRRVAVPGWRGFNFVVNGGEGNNGDYLRAFGTLLESGDTSEGLNGTVTAGVTGTSLYELHQMSVEFTGELTALHLGGSTEVTELSWEGNHDVGQWVAEAAP